MDISLDWVPDEKALEVSRCFEHKDVLVRVLNAVLKSLYPAKQLDVELRVQKAIIEDGKHGYGVLASVATNLILMPENKGKFGLKEIFSLKQNLPLLLKACKELNATHAATPCEAPTPNTPSTRNQGHALDF